MNRLTSRSPRPPGSASARLRGRGPWPTDRGSKAGPASQMVSVASPRSSWSVRSRVSCAGQLDRRAPPWSIRLARTSLRQRSSLPVGPGGNSSRRQLSWSQSEQRRSSRELGPRSRLMVPGGTPWSRTQASAVCSACSSSATIGIRSSMPVDSSVALTRSLSPSRITMRPPF